MGHKKPNKQNWRMSVFCKYEIRNKVILHKPGVVLVYWWHDLLTCARFEFPLLQVIFTFVWLTKYRILFISIHMFSCIQVQSIVFDMSKIFFDQCIFCLHNRKHSQLQRIDSMSLWRIYWLQTNQWGVCLFLTDKQYLYFD